MFGSCFSDNIGNKLKEAMFNVDINPYGTTFNPASINISINRILSNISISKTDLFEQNGVWNSYYYHSRFSGIDIDSVTGNMNSRMCSAYNNLKSAKTLILTFGTAYVYTHTSLGIVVNNCHKVHSKEFIRTKIDVENIVDWYNKTIIRILKLNPTLKIIFTVSPIRHLSDGLAVNQLSKSILRIAINRIIELFPDSCSYFPAYEIMMDDLRDYRFYATDMIHPSDVAIDYIWDIFQQSYLTQQDIEIACKCCKISKRLTHRPMTENQDLISNFNAETNRLVEQLIKEYPYIKIGK